MIRLVQFHLLTIANDSQTSRMAAGHSDGLVRMVRRTIGRAQINKENLWKDVLEIMKYRPKRMQSVFHLEKYEMLSNKLYLNMLLLACILFAGCVLENVEERGEICPPGRLMNSKGGRHVVFSNLDCYNDYILLKSDMSAFGKSCHLCSEQNDNPVEWQCSGDLSDCFENGFDNLKQNYEHCDNYRKHGILEEGSKAKLEISFVRDFLNTDVSPEDYSNNLSNSCPKEYELCKYDRTFHHESDENEESIDGAYGCYQSCTGTLLYCGKGSQRHCIDPNNDSDYCGARGDCSDSNAETANWQGKACGSGMICQNGQCICAEGYKVCDNAGGICVDVMHNAEHCGDTCEACDSDMVCIDGACVKYGCGETRGRCQKNDCQNSDDACGESCMDCHMENVEEAHCSDGQCQIIKCKVGYHIEKNGNMYECRRNSVERCAPPEKPEDSDYAEVVNCTEIENSKEVICGSEGNCIVKQCKYGHEVSLGQTQCVELNCGACDEASEVCENGTCQCKPGWVSCGPNGGNCKDIINDPKHCGGCDIECDLSGVDHMQGFGCQFALCAITECDALYHPFGQVCELNDEDNCGEHGRNCLDDIPNVKEAICDKDNSKCLIKVCKEQFHIYDQECEADTQEDCNEHEHACVVEGVEEAECQWDDALGHSVCVASKCVDGYHLSTVTNNPNDKVICEKDDESNCGATGIVCPINSHCLKDNGAYVCSCDSGYKLCSNECVNDFMTNNKHCGECNNTCLGDLTCISGQCDCTSHTKCGTSCIDIHGSDKQHCGGCDASCKEYQSCVSGVCGCTDGKTDCGNGCVNIHGNDVNNCGACGTKCSDVGKSVCSNGTCGCGELAECSGKCVNINASDVNNCGACGKQCSRNEVCNVRNCECKSGTLVCGGQCVGPDIKGTPKANNDITVRDTPSVNGSQLSLIKNGEELRIYGYSQSSTGWYRVKKNNGYVNAEYVTLCEGYAFVNTSNDPLNMWPEVGVKKNSRGQIPKGTGHLCLHKRVGDWYYVSYGKNSGYVDGQYLIVNEDIAPIPSVGHCQ